MYELHTIIPYCCIAGKYYRCNNSFVDGYAIGVISILITMMLCVSISELIVVCKGAQTVESDDEAENKEGNSEEKPEEDKKDD